MHQHGAGVKAPTPLIPAPRWAAWKKTSGEGREYLSVKLDDPSFPAPIYATLVEAEEPNTFNLIWSRRNGD